MAIKTIEVNGVEYQVDYAGLANKPVPAATADDSGKVLMVDVGGFPQWTTASMVPEFDPDFDQGKVLVVYGSDGLGWVDPSELPL